MTPERGLLLPNCENERTVHRQRIDSRSSGYTEPHENDAIPTEVLVKSKYSCGFPMVEPALSPHLRSEEICRREDIHVRADELRPSGGLLSLRGRRYALALQNVTDGLVAHFMPEVGQRSGNPVVTPRLVLLGETQHQLVDVGVDPRSPWILSAPGAVELLRDKPPVPTQERVGFHDTRDVKNLLTQTLSALRQRPPFAIRQAHVTLDLTRC